MIGKTLHLQRLGYSSGNAYVLYSRDPGSNLGQGTDYLERGSSWLFFIYLGKFRIFIWNQVTTAFLNIFSD
jgi:hypothetical protein